MSLKYRNSWYWKLLKVDLSGNTVKSLNEGNYVDAFLKWLSVSSFCASRNSAKTVVRVAAAFGWV